MSVSTRSIHALLARELTKEEIDHISGSNANGIQTQRTTEPTFGDTIAPIRHPWDTMSNEADDDGSWDASVD